MVSNLTWAPAAGGGTQSIQFQIDGTTAWITFATVGPTISSQGITGLEYNTLYHFRVVNNCPTGSTTQVAGQDIVIQCPNPLITPSDTAATVQFFHLGGTIDSYQVLLLDANNNAIQTLTLSPPFNASITTSFTGMTPVTTYGIRIVPASGTINKTNCPTTSFTTTNTPTCPAAVGLDVTFS